MKREHRRGQVTVEVAVLFAAVIAALFFMAMYLQRGAQGGVKGSADSLGTQFGGRNPWTQNTHSVSNEVGNRIEQNSNTDFSQTLTT